MDNYDSGVRGAKNIDAAANCDKAFSRLGKPEGRPHVILQTLALSHEEQEVTFLGLYKIPMARPRRVSRSAHLQRACRGEPHSFNRLLNDPTSAATILLFQRRTIAVGSDADRDFRCQSRTETRGPPITYFGLQRLAKDRGLWKSVLSRGKVVIDNKITNASRRVQFFKRGPCAAIIDVLGSVARSPTMST